MWKMCKEHKIWVMAHGWWLNLEFEETY